MGCKIFCIVAVVFFGCSLVHGRVFYVDGPASNLSPSRGSYAGYPVMYQNEDSEHQASRDLDLSFSAGDHNEISDDMDVIYPAKKVYVQAPPERPIYEVNRDYERPMGYYKVFDMPTRRVVYGDQYPISNRKLVKLNNDNNGPHKGEIVLELRVIANNNNNDQ